jgi:hypothetical protein
MVAALTASRAIEGRLPLVVEELAALSRLDLVEAAAEGLFLAGELGAKDARVVGGDVEGHLLELVPGFGCLVNQIRAVVGAGDVKVAGHHPQLAIAAGGVDQPGDKVGQVFFAEVVVKRLQAVSLDVLGEEAAVVPADIIVDRASGKVLHQSLVGLKAVALEDNLNLGPGLFLPGGDDLVQLVVVGAANGVHAHGLAIKRLTDNGGCLGRLDGGCLGRLRRLGGLRCGATGGQDSTGPTDDTGCLQKVATREFLLFGH